MAYEYNPESARFNLPNPHRVENALLLVAALAQLIAAPLLLAHGRQLLLVAEASNHQLAAILPLFVGIALLISGLLLVWRVMRQLVFYFGRDQPAPLADVISPQQDGVTASGQRLRETVRQNAISFETPVNGFDQLLYKFIPDLVFSPPPVQINARGQFRNGVVLLAILLCFVIASVGVVNPAATSWIDAGFFLLTAYVVLRPMRIETQMRRGFVRFIVLIVLSVIGPVLLSFVVKRSLPLPASLHLGAMTLLFLLSAVGGNVLFLLALFGHTLRPESISMANQLETLSMNAHPRQLVVEFDRQMQARWTEKIPNRSYLRVTPVIAGETGGFQGEVLEETQPVPRDSGRLRFAEALKLREYRFLTVLDLYALGMALLGTGLALWAAYRPWPEGIDALLAGVVFVIVAWYCFEVSGFLWRRFEFSSRLYWLELSGNFQLSNAEYGRLLEDAVKTRKQVVNIEDMTLRVWVADLYSVSFGPDQPRFLLSMSGEQTEAQRLSRHLRAFAEGQRTLIAPASSRDIETAAQLAALNASRPPAAAPELPAGAAAAAGRLSTKATDDSSS